VRIVRRRCLERFLEPPKSILVELKEPAIQENRLRFASGRFQHELCTILSDRRRSAIDQSARRFTGSQVDDSRSACARHPCLLRVSAIDGQISVLYIRCQYVAIRFAPAEHYTASDGWESVGASDWTR